MASSKDYLQFVLEQLSEMTSRVLMIIAMFGSVQSVVTKIVFPLMIFMNQKKILETSISR